MTEAVALEFTDPSGEPVRIEWRTEALAALGPEEPGREPVWRLGGELDWDEVEALRVVSGRLEDDRLMAVAALRPVGASGHGEELVAGVLGDRAQLDRLAQVLLSTEYGADGSPQRVGLELYGEDGGLAVRVAGDATETETETEGGVRHVRTALALRGLGASGVGVLDVLAREPS